LFTGNRLLPFVFYYRITKPEKTTFHLLHLSLFREYLDWEFSDLKVTKKLNNPKIVSWVLLVQGSYMYQFFLEVVSQAIIPGDIIALANFTCLFTDLHMPCSAP